MTYCTVVARGTTRLSGRGDAIACTKVLLYPLTGRTHQLRVHLSAAGYPIVGDKTYAPELRAKRCVLLARWIALEKHVCIYECLKKENDVHMFSAGGK